MKNQASCKPEGFHSAVPYLHVSGAAKLIEFMKQVFDAQEIVRYPMPDGGEKWPPMPCALHVYVPDTDATYRRALAAGCTTLQEPADQFYGEHSASVRDICGNNWYLATQTEVLSREDIDKRIAAMAGK